MPKRSPAPFKVKRAKILPEKQAAVHLAELKLEQAYMDPALRRRDELLTARNVGAWPVPVAQQLECHQA